MNITNLNQNKKLFCKPLSSDYTNHDLRSTLDLKLPKILKLNLHTIKTLKKSDNQKQALEKFFLSLKEPIPLKINDILFVPKYDLFKLQYTNVSIVYEKDPKDDITSLGLKLPKTVEVGPLSYSKYP